MEVWVTLEVIALGTEALEVGNQVVPQEFVLGAGKVITGLEIVNLNLQGLSCVGKRAEGPGSGPQTPTSKQLMGP